VTERTTSDVDTVAEVLSLPEMEERARSCMPFMAYEYVTAASADEHTARWNNEAYGRIRLRTHVLRDVASIDTRVTLFDRELPFPILLAPTAYQRLMHTEGELATARGAGAANATLVVSTGTNTPIEDIGKVATAPLWFQLYVQPDREYTRALVQRAEDAGCQALCLTVDTPTLGVRNRQARAQVALPPGVTTPHLYDDFGREQRVTQSRHVSVTWPDIDWLLSFARIPLLLKGILDDDDAELGVQSGAHGIIVSNHGARNLDTVPATIDALPQVVERVDGRIPVLVDGGIRRGTDVLKALALGAKAVLIGRPYCYGLGVGGSDGVCRVVNILRQELEMAMMFTGCSSIREIDASVLWDRPS
jgi:4-hydroxymandelate oxidase